MLSIQPSIKTHLWFYVFYNNNLLSQGYHIYIYIYIYIYIGALGFTLSSEFRDVVFEDVVVDNNRFRLILYLDLT